jgi:glycyl-tRNA synthetase
MQYSDVFQAVVSHTKEHGFIFQSSEIYDGLGAVYDYGPLGALMKRNLIDLWWRSMVQLNDNIVGLDSSILMHPTVWKASGHVDAFNDPLIDNKDSKKRYRADVLIEDHIAKYWDKARKDADKRAAKEGWPVGGPEYTAFLEKGRNGAKAKELEEKYAAALNSGDLQALKAFIDEEEIADPESGSRNWTEVRQFNLMFSTQLGAVVGEGGTLYLRPETAQGIFVNFLNVQKSQRLAIPFGIAQVGKAFRNEIVARQFIFRMREFEQMEMQFFIKPGTQREWFEHWRETRLRWHTALGIPPHRLNIHTHEKLAHYADAAVDIQFQFPFGFKELEGIHSRTDFDLGRHEEYSKKKLRYFDPETKESYVPYVIETSVGLDRTFLTHLCNAYTEEPAPTADGESATRTVLKLHPLVAPVKVAVLPLVKKDGMPEVAQRIFDDLKWEFQALYDEKDTVGRRYRRQDGRGTPYCVCVDDLTLKDETVTIRHRDTMEQVRVHATQVATYLRQQLDWRAALG